MAQKIAVVLFNLGGPDRQEAVRPFLFNLFNDPAIIRLPSFVRTPLAWFISRRRAPVAQEIYEQMGGGSPLLPNTEAQARALEAALADLGTVKCFIAMRYWHPMTAETVAAVRDWQPDEVLLLPLYPQWSTTTTGSSFKLWFEMARAFGLSAPTKQICCYPQDNGFVTAYADLIRNRYDLAAGHGAPRVLFSAHGLPKKIVSGGDPYQWQCERSAEAIVAKLAIDGLDWVNCYQSRVGPMEWIGPSTDDEIRRAGKDGVPVVVVPMAFVSEHSETLVELGIEYRHLAAEVGVPYYDPVPTVSTSPAFIDGLAALARSLRLSPKTCRSGRGGRICPAQFGGCGWVKSA
jgi:protoporphyrin/coproporphyrin ferrochelatase